MKPAGYTKIMNLRSLPLLILLFTLGFAMPAQGQIFEPAPNVSISASPSAPKPGQEVTLTARSITLNVNNATFTWRSGGIVIAQGPGVKSAKVIAGAIGSNTVVSVTASEGGKTAEGSIAVRPAEVDLLWETNTYVPPFYKGKALPTPGSTITVLAMPNMIESGASLSPQSVSFEWKQNGTLLSRLSGLGKNSIAVDGPRTFGPMTISVRATSGSGQTIAENSVVIQNTNPELIFYEEDPILGTRMESALQGEVHLQNEEITIGAHPYYLMPNDIQNGNIEYNWTLNGSPIDKQATKGNTVTLRNTGTGSGTALVSLALRAIDMSFQKAEGSFRIQFGQPNQTNGFENAAQ